MYIYTEKNYLIVYLTVVLRMKCLIFAKMKCAKNSTNMAIIKLRFHDFGPEPRINLFPPRLNAKKTEFCL